VEHSEGKDGESVMAIPSEVSMWSPSSVSVKERTILAPMASLVLCTDHMLVFMGPNKPSSFCNYCVKPHLPASCGAFTFGGRMRPGPRLHPGSRGLILI
jgi:hypothetical protein